MGIWMQLSEAPTRSQGNEKSLYLNKDVRRDPSFSRDCKSKTLMVQMSDRTFL